MKEIEVTKEFIVDMQRFKEKPKGKGLLEACRDSVILYSQYMLGIDLYAWQVYFLKDLQDVMEGNVEEEECLSITSRQIGKSTSLAIFNSWCAVFNKKPGTIHNNTIGLIISRSDTQAKKLLREVTKILRHGDSFMAEKYRDNDDKPVFGDKFFTGLLSKNDPNNTTTITFQPHAPKHGDILLYGSKAGSVIQCHPPTPVVLGETFSIGSIDEAGHEKITDDFFFNDLYPTGDSTDCLWVYTSTPWKPSGFFYTFVDPDNMFGQTHMRGSCFTIEALKNEPSERAQRQYEKVKKKITRLNRDGKIDEVQRSYYCRFIKGDNSYFDPEKVRDIFDERMLMSEKFTKPCDMGVDFGGQVTSKTVITISYLDDDDKIHRLYHKQYEVGKDMSLLDDMAELMTRFNIQRVIPDDCPAGDFLIRVMKDEKGWDVQPMNFRTDKVKKYGAFRSMLNKGRVFSYKDDLLQTEMMALENSQGSRQSVIMPPKGYNDDMIDSFVLSTYFMVQDDTGLSSYDWDEAPEETIMDKIRRARGNRYEGPRNSGF